MSWFIKKSPFGRDEDPVQHLLAILSQEAERAGTPLTDSDKEILRRENSRNDPVPEELRRRTKDLIAKVLEAEPWDEFERDPKSFSNSLEWADPSYLNVVVLAEEVSCENSYLSPPLRGWKRVKDRLQLVGCGVIVVLLMLAVVMACGFLFRWQ